jgi:hypothetical protein
MPLEVELYRNHRRSIIGRRLQQLLDGEDVEMGTWYARAKKLIEEEMQNIAGMADDEGQIDATQLRDDATEMLSMFLDNQETCQEVCLVLEKDASKAKTVVINRPMAFKLTDHLGQLVLNGAFRGKDKKFSERKDLIRFMMAFSSECAVYVGGSDDQGEAASSIVVELMPLSKESWMASTTRWNFDSLLDAIIMRNLRSTLPCMWENTNPLLAPDLWR